MKGEYYFLSDELLYSVSFLFAKDDALFCHLQLQSARIMYIYRKIYQSFFLFNRYKACKESQAQAFYKLATLTALQNYYQNHLSMNGSTSPISPLFLQQQLLARAAVAAASNSALTSPPANAGIPIVGEPPKIPGLDLTLKSVGLGSPPLKPFGVKRSSPESPKRASPKKTKMAPRRKASRKLAFDEDKTSPVSGTIIRELAEGEEVPAIRKGKQCSN